MGFQKRWDLNSFYRDIRAMAAEVKSPYNDGYIGIHCKEELYMLKCFIEDIYQDLPYFSGEELWEQHRIIDKLKK